MEPLHSKLQLVAVILCSNFSSLWFVQQRCHRSHVTGALIVLLHLWSSLPSYSIVEEEPAAWSLCFPIFFVCGGWGFFVMWEVAIFSTWHRCALLNLIPIEFNKSRLKESWLFTKFFSHPLLERTLCGEQPLCELLESLLWTKCGRIWWPYMLYYFKIKSVFARLVNWSIILNRFA